VEAEAEAGGVPLTPCSQRNGNAQGEGLRGGESGCKHTITHPFPPGGMFLYTLTTTTNFLCSFLTPATTLPLSRSKREPEGPSLVPNHPPPPPPPLLETQAGGGGLVFHHLTLPLPRPKHEPEGPSLVPNHPLPLPCLKCERGRSCPPPPPLLETQAGGGCSLLCLIDKIE